MVQKNRRKMLSKIDIEFEHYRIWERIRIYESINLLGCVVIRKIRGDGFILVNMNDLLWASNNFEYKKRIQTDMFCQENLSAFIYLKLKSNTTDLRYEIVEINATIKQRIMYRLWNLKILVKATVERELECRIVS